MTSTRSTTDDGHVRSSTPTLGLHLRTFSSRHRSWEGLLEQARAADDAGVDRLVVSDHVVMGENLEQYGNPAAGGVAGGVQPTGPDGQWLEPLTVLSVLAGTTTRVRLGTRVLLAALRRPIVLAKAAATLDVLSNGRLDLGVGIGWQREEYEAAGLPFGERGALLDHSLEVLQAAWRDSPVSYSSDRLAFDGVHVRPHPEQPGGVPVWVGGTLNRRTLGRLARFGSGWIPWGPDAADPAAGLARIRESLQEAGRSADGFRVQGMLPAPTHGDGRLDTAAAVRGAAEQAARGVTDFVTYVELPGDRPQLDDVLGRLVADFRAAVG